MKKKCLVVKRGISCVSRILKEVVSNMEWSVSDDVDDDV